jgi:predicted nucleotidyltransferase
MHRLNFPNQDYRRILETMCEYFRRYPGTSAIVLTGSLARGKAVKGSCIDLAVFLGKEAFASLGSTVNRRAKAYARLGGRICYHSGNVEGGVGFGNIRVDLIFTDGRLDPQQQDSYDVTRDEFETTVGNLFVYSVPMYVRGRAYQRLGERYLPFYDDRLRKIRLQATATEFQHKTWKARWLAERGEYTAALYSLLEAQRIFIQHLFIKERKYPIDYVKWLREQCEGILRMPDLYQELASTLRGIELTQEGIAERSAMVEALFAKYCSKG